MTPERLAEIEARFQALRPKEDRGGEELKMMVLPQRGFPNSTPTKIFYADGNGCATISSNIGLGVDGDALAIFWANAWFDVRDLIKAVKDLTTVAQTRKIFVYRPISNGACNAVAYSDNGKEITQHFSSSYDFFRYDMGLNGEVGIGKSKFQYYREECPEGFELVECIGRAALEKYIDSGELKNFSFS